MSWQPSAVSSRLRRIGRGVEAALTRVLGAPDYEAYVAHARAAHPQSEPLTRAEFERGRLNDRYSRPGTRCC